LKQGFLKKSEKQILHYILQPLKSFTKLLQILFLLNGEALAEGNTLLYLSKLFSPEKLKLLWLVRRKWRWRGLLLGHPNVVKIKQHYLIHKVFGQ
jgi:hypothetical protein